MSVNKYKPHIRILPEDTACADILNGFMLHDQLMNTIQMLSVAGGWPKAKTLVQDVHVPEMQRNTNIHLIVLIDMDKKNAPNIDIEETRRLDFQKILPSNLQARVAILGAWKDPESLTRNTNRSREEIGMQLASDCYDGTRSLWEHEDLRHNLSELDRIGDQLRKILFSDANLVDGTDWNG